jgi:long-chain fatty acid transport protein
MKTLVRLLLTVVLATGLTTGLFANGLNLNGTGAKSDAMGGAFVGLANDFSAAYWNPAGLAQITKASFSLYGADILPTGTYVVAPYGIDAKSTPKSYLIPGLGYFRPIGKKIVVGVYLYAPSGAGANWDGEDLTPLTGGDPFLWNSKLGIFTVSPSIAYKISDKVLIGATVDVNYGMLKMDQPFQLGQYSEDLKGWAVGGTLGLLIKPVEQFSFGVSYKIPFTAKLKGDVTIPYATMLPGVTTTMETGTREATWPMWLAAGIAVKPTDKLTITADIQYTNWKKLQTIPVSFEDPAWEGYFGVNGPTGPPPVGTPNTNRTDEFLWKDTFQYRFGAEYWISNSFALRAGYYIDENPGPPETQNILLPEFKYNWFTAGFGYQSGKLVIDAAIQYGTGADIDVPLDPVHYAMPGVHGMSMWVPSLNFTYKF